MSNETKESCFENCSLSNITERELFFKDEETTTIKVTPNPIPLENIKLAYELCTNRSWDEGLIEDER